MDFASFTSDCVPRTVLQSPYHELVLMMRPMMTWLLMDKTENPLPRNVMETSLRQTREEIVFQKGAKSWVEPAIRSTRRNIKKAHSLAILPLPLMMSPFTRRSCQRLSAIRHCTRWEPYAILAQLNGSQCQLSDTA